MIPENYISEKQKIENQIEKLKEEVNELQKRHRGPALASILKAMREYDISIEDITAASSGTRSSRRASSRTTVPPKYRDPATGSTWTGRGRTPRWLVDAEAQGHKRDDFLIKNA